LNETTYNCGYCGKSLRFKILMEAQLVEPYADTARAHADADRAALGFTPASAYREAAFSGKLLIAVEEAFGQRDTYAGHLYFGGAYPHVRIFQVYVVPKYRRRRVGALLLQTLAKRSEDIGCLSISARVAGDLDVANAFWKNEGFQVLRFKKGGTSRGRTIAILTRELDTPRLFGGSQGPRNQGHAIAISTVGRTRSYLIDLNVFLDLVKARSQADHVRRLIAAAWTRTVDVFVAEELVEELRRSATGGPDPVLEFASALPRLPRVPHSLLEERVKELALVIFPDRAGRNALTPNDRSDLIYLATSIHHGVNGFITGEKAILRRVQNLRVGFGIDVVGTAEFSRYIVPAEHHPQAELRSSGSNDDFSISEMSEEDRQSAQEFLREADVSEAISTDALSPGVSGAPRRRIQVRIVATGEYVGFASWDAPLRLSDRLNVYIFVDEDHPDAPAVATHLCAEILRDVAARGPILLTLRTPEGHFRARAAAVDAGFGAVVPGGEDRALHKLSIGGVVTTSNWPAVSAKLQELVGLSLESAMPTFAGSGTKILFRSSAGEPSEISILEAERLFGPALFLSPMRHGMLVPIRREFAEQLFSGAPQLSLLPKRQATLFSDRVYFRAPTGASSFSVGTPLVFYESRGSNGRGCAFTLATVRSNRVVWAETLSARLLVKGALDLKTITKMSKDGLISLLHFESIIPFQQQVRLDRLRAMGAIDGANAVGPRRLDTQTLAAIASEANVLAM
jgi:GNAT superfamily N-acetyltransferase/predicted nucleic acid-binding protein